MTWAGQRRFVIGAILIVLVVALLSVTLIASVYHAPSCSDNKQNQGEQGVDCGGPCALLCQAQVSPPVVRFTQAVPSGATHTDVIAYIVNSNTTAAAYGVKYSILLYDTSHVIAYSGIEGSIDLPPGATVPIFVPNIPVQGNISSAFTTLDTTSTIWKAGTDTRVLPQIGSATIVGTPATPRVNVTLSNPTVTPMKNVHLVATLFDAAGNVITASQTLVQTIPPQGSAVATFNWIAPFGTSVSRVDVVPLVPLP